MPFKTALAGLVVASTASLLLAQQSLAEAAEASDALDDAIARIVDKYKLKGIAVAIVHKDFENGPLVRVAGIKNCEGDKVDLDTAFMLASSSKTYAGVAAAIAIEKGFIKDVDADVQDILPYSARNPTFPSKPVTLRHLLTHRSSMVGGAPMSVEGFQKDPTYAPESFGLNPTCPLDQLATWYHDLLEDRPAQSDVGGLNKQGKPIVPNWHSLAKTETGGSWNKECKPGQCYEYSNLGTGFVGAVVEQAYRDGVNTEANFQDFCKKFIFDPAGMTNTAWFSRDLPDGDNEAKPFNYQHGNGKYICKQNYCFTDYPSGSLRTSARDMGKYLDMMVHKGAVGGKQIMSRDTFAAITTCLDQDENGKQAKCESGYLWGLLSPSRFKFLSPRFGDFADFRSAVYHDGAEFGTMSEMLVLPEQGVAVGFVSNTNQEYGKTQMDSFDILKELVAAIPESDSHATPSTEDDSHATPSTEEPDASSEEPDGYRLSQEKKLSCFAGRGPKAKPIGTSKTANSEAACKAFCQQKPKCVGFDYTTKKTPNACRLFKEPKKASKKPRPGSTRLDRTYCSMK